MGWRNSRKPGNCICGKAIIWGVDTKGDRHPYNLSGGSHFMECRFISEKTRNKVKKLIPEDV